MPEQLTKEDIDTGNDALSKQYDDSVDLSQKIKDLESIISECSSVGLLTTQRPDIGPVSRIMNVAKHTGPDFYFIANAHSKKFKDLDSSKTAQITFQTNNNYDWASISGTATVTSNNDPRIKELYSAGTKAWFGDLNDGKHTGGPDDPRMALIEVKAKYITYWKTTVGTLGLVKEVGLASLTGGVAQTGVQREFSVDEVERYRKESQ